MARKIAYFSVLLSIFALFLSCKKTREYSGVVLNTDSIFYDLGKEKLAKSTKRTDTFFKGLARNGLNGTVLYAEQGQLVYENAFGWRDLCTRHKDSIRIDDAFQLSSDSKMFTAEAIMLLQSRGQLEYDEDVRKYIPELPYNGVTIRQLLNHRSGLPRYDALADAHWPDRKVPFSNEAMIKMLAEKNPEPYAVPDAVFFYNNINYALLATVVERVTGQNFEDFMFENIFDPLGMTHSYIYSMRDENWVSLYMPTNVHGHEMRRKGPEKSQNDYLNGVMGDKIMFSTVGDLYKFHIALECSLLLPDSLQCESFKPGSAEWKKDENYGFGWRMNKEHPDTYFHYGWWKGYRSLIIRDVAHNRYLVVLTNTTQLIPDDVWDFINDTSVQLPAASYYPDYYRKTIRSLQF